MDMDSEWSIKIAKSTPVMLCKVIGVRNNFFSIGYIEGEDIFNVYIWDEDESHWKMINKNRLPEYSDSASVVVYKECIFFWGGSLTFLYQFNTETKRWTKPNVHGIIPQRRQNHMAIVVKGKMIIFGGEINDVNLMEHKYADFVYSLDLNTFTWDIVESPSFDLSSYKLIHFGVEQDRFVHFIEQSGFKSEYKKPKIIYFDLLLKEWKDKQIVQEFPKERKILEAYKFNGIIFLFCFEREVTAILYFDSIYLLNPANGNVIKKNVPPQNSSYSYIGCCKIESKIAMSFNGWLTIPNDYLSIEQEKEVESVLEDYGDYYFMFYMDLKHTNLFSLQSLCVMEILHSKLDTSKLPKCLQDKIAKF